MAMRNRNNAKSINRKKNKLIGVITGVLLGILSSVSAFAADEAPVAKTLFTNVNVFDGKNETLINKANVLIEGNLIKLVSTEAIKVEGATVIDGGGRTLMPGLIDAHWHVMFNAASIPVLVTADMEYLTLLGARSAEETLLRGFTTVRDVGGNPFGIKRGIDEGMIVGPRIYPSGPMIS